MTRSTRTSRGSASRWKQYQNTTQSQKRTRLGIAALVFVVVIVVIGQFFSFLTRFTASKNYQWTGQSTINIVVRTDQLYALSYNPIDSQVTLLKIPDDTYMTVPGGFGRWPARSIYDLGQGEKVPRGPELLEQTIAFNFGIPIDGYLSFQSDQPLETTIQNLRKNPFLSLQFIRQGTTDLSRLELTRLVWGWWGVRQDKIKTVDMGQSQVTESILMPDGSRALGLDQIKMDNLIKEQFEDITLNYEGLTIGIYNGTDHPGLADRVARIITNMGGRVVYTNTTKTPVTKSFVLGGDNYTHTRLTQVFASDKPQPLDIDSSRADVIVVLGEDANARFTGQ